MSGDEKGKPEALEVPELSKSGVEVMIVPLNDDESHLISASQSSTDFWENETDDQVWNNA